MRLRLQIQAGTSCKWSGKTWAELQKVENDAWNTNPFYHKIQSSAIIQILRIFVNVWGNVLNGFFILGKPSAYGSARLGHIPSLPGKPQLPLKPCVWLQPFYFERQLRFLRFSLRFQCYRINTSVKEGSLPSLTIYLAELSQLDRSSPAAKEFYNVLL